MNGEYEHGKLYTKYWRVIRWFEKSITISVQRVRIII